ncbi:GumC family protein [Desulfoscipio geothermicus]|uniref:Uncharacterized protein involved in exopolysaccharide biosynthesis n=1 Tax=Desulfoscipio geothermicus DSM 3669 TaxID=1121426 RepID=A0A1I6E9N8_9FIRM|nr:Wzz/FepE/Etk N-terminal domain-containing protein [Desulfoscipio geothermicus]SFR14262.1 Uncharacterized protein involved in exopolysaccharide biosynthesis [Desulfoscipio geothermicus DSM 3669]
MEEEINLRELIEVLINGKWIIIGICFVSVLLAGVLSFFVLPEKYEARATIMVKEQPKTEPENGSLEALLSSLSKSPEMTVEAYRQQVTNPWILQKVIKELELDPEVYSIKSLREAISTEVVKDTNLIRITVSGTDPILITSIANTLAKNFVQYISEKTTHQLGMSVEFLGTQIKEQEKELAAAVNEYQKFLAQPGGVRELEQEINAKLTLLTDFKNQLIRNQVEIEQNRASLKQVESNLAETPEKLVTEKNLADDAYLFNVAGEASGASVKDLSGLRMQSEEINPTYIGLVNERANLKKTLANLSAQQEQLKVQISLAQKELENLQAELAEKRVENDRLEQKVNMLRNNYKAIQERYEETKLSKAAQVGENNLILLSPAIEPENPVGPRKMLNMAVAGVLGMMVSVFLVFFREFWRKSAPQVAAGVNNVK